MFKYKEIMNIIFYDKLWKKGVKAKLKCPKTSQVEKS